MIFTAREARLIGEISRNPKLKTILQEFKKNIYAEAEKGNYSAKLPLFGLSLAEFETIIILLRDLGFNTRTEEEGRYIICYW